LNSRPTVYEKVRPWCRRWKQRAMPLRICRLIPLRPTVNRQLTVSRTKPLVVHAPRRMVQAQRGWARGTAPSPAPPWPLPRSTVARKELSSLF
jgi:hypothetical protein